MLTTWLDLPPWAIAVTLIAFYGLTATPAPDRLSLANAPPSGEFAGHDHAILYNGQYPVCVDDRVPRHWCLGILSHRRADGAART